MRHELYVSQPWRSPHLWRQVLAEPTIRARVRSSPRGLKKRQELDPACPRVLDRHAVMRGRWGLAHGGYSARRGRSGPVIDGWARSPAGIIASPRGKAVYVYDEMLLTVNADKATPVDRVDLSDLDLREREHLQEWILANPAVLGPNVEIIASEYDRWQTAGGVPVLDRLDILAVDPDGRLVVAELKRGVAPHTVHMQAINYAAMVSRLTPDDIAELYAATHRRAGEDMDTASALTILTTERLLTTESIRRPRIVLVASDFPASVTSAVVWLNEQSVDISLIRYRPYRLANGQLVVSFTRLYPVPDVEEFTIGRRPEAPAVGDVVPDVPWDEVSLRNLADQGNAATIAMLDLCSAGQATAVGVKDVAQQAGISEGAVRGQLAGLTMRLKNPAYGFAQTTWPVTITWLPGGFVGYRMDPGLAATWRAIRQDPASPPTDS
jgi:hypothetical protein